MARARSDLVAPRVSAPDLPPQLGDAVGRRACDLSAARVTLSGEADLAHSSLEQCRLDIAAESVDLTGSILMDVELSTPRAASLSMRDATVRRLRIEGGRIGTLDLAGARLAEVELRDVRIDYLSLSGARGEDVLLAGCQLRTLDMPQAELTRVRFDDCRVDEVDPRGMRAAHLDLRGLDALSFLDVSSLRGATMTPRQVEALAPVFAVAAGITLRD